MNYNIGAEKKQALLEKIQKKRGYNKQITTVLKTMGEELRAAYIDGCATYIEVTTTEEMARITNANFCRQRLCNVCAWRRQARYYSQMVDVERVMRERGYTAGRFYFTTLTVKNCWSQDVGKTVGKMLEAWKRLVNNRNIKSRIEGYVRAIEITYNQERKNYHPHIHVVFALKEGAEPPKADSLAKSWAAAMDLEYTPIIDIRQCKDGTNKDVIKYSLKYRYKDVNQTTISTYLYTLAGKRLVSFGGIYSKIRRELRQNNFDEALTDEKAGGGENIEGVIVEHYLINTTSGIYELVKEE